MTERTTPITADDIYLFNEGTHCNLAAILGAHIEDRGTRFAVWAPAAEQVSVIGDFNGWDPRADAMVQQEKSGIWEGFIPGVAKGAVYKYHIVSHVNAYRVDKADPFAFRTEEPPTTGSIVWDLAYDWHDEAWMRERGARAKLTDPMSIYELHIGSWRRGDGDRRLNYREIAEPLADHCARLGFTHVEFMPVMEHPFYGSWGYQTTGYFAPTARFGEPQDFMYLTDHLHQRGIGVILDWVPSHFPTDEHGLAFFDGTHLYEHADPRQGFHPDWKSAIFNYGRNEVRSFLISSAMHWLGPYHADGLRVDAVASMLYLDYSREAGEWIPNEFGGRENLDAISFIRRLNSEVYREHPDVHTIAEESTAWPMVSRPTYVGGLGFGYKWDMGWMHDTLSYFARDPIHRRYHHNDLTFRSLYQYTENFALPLSHDEVVHGKGSLIGKMPGDDWQKFANLRALLGHQWTSPGKKLLFMGCELAQWREWSHERALDWHLLDYERHAGIARWVGDLNNAYFNERALHEGDCEPWGFQWVDAGDANNSVASFMRFDRDARDLILVAFNFTPMPRENHMLGVPRAGFWSERLNSDSEHYGGSGMGNLGGVHAQPVWMHGHPHAVDLTLPPLSCVVLKSSA